MQLVSIDMGFVFLLASLGLFAPLVLMTSQAKTARVFAIALIVGSNVVGCFVAALCFWRESDAVVDLSRFTPFPFALGHRQTQRVFSPA